MSNPLQYVNGEHRLIDDINFAGLTYFSLICRLVLEKPLAIFYLIPGVSNDEQVNEFVQTLCENDCRLDLYTEHQGYDVLELDA